MLNPYVNAPIEAIEKFIREYFDEYDMPTIAEKTNDSTDAHTWLSLKYRLIGEDNKYYFVHWGMVGLHKFTNGIEVVTSLDFDGISSLSTGDYVETRELEENKRLLLEYLKDGIKKEFGEVEKEKTKPEEPAEIVDPTIKKILELRAKDVPIATIGELANVSRSTVNRVLDEHGKTKKRKSKR